MSPANGYDPPGTAVHLPALPERFGAGLGYGSCECSPTDGQSCFTCDGTAAEQREFCRDLRGPLLHRATCDNGLVAVLATDGEGFDWLACLGCIACPDPKENR